jgi:hypothetical protein
VITFSSVKELADALEEVQQPIIETEGVDGPPMAISDPEGISTIVPNSWVHVETDYNAWAQALARWAAARPR